MSWLDAYESYVIEVAARDRANDLQSAAAADAAHIEQTTVPPSAVPGARGPASAGPLLYLYRLARASR